ncbi:hypothetical protein L3Y34_008669 [Caenorhabditis briggsae]|uniref:glucuronosyltransferase n=2 Tax=Caenorhabditis briggsae TaxID=6238 RepID=A0AAE9AA06_CAEBR|nr:hypothetical protein L3Y34_008669 [Caenorhabditis briggsae]
MRLLFLLFPLFCATFEYNFLVYCPLFGHSHTKFFATIADSLTDAGHNVTFFTPTIVEKYRDVNYTKSTKDVVHMEPSEKLRAYGEQMESGEFVRFWTEDSSATEIIPVIELFQNMYNEQAEVMRDNLGFLDDLKRRNFDVIIFESYVFSAYPLMDYLDIKSFIPSLSLTHDVALAQSIGEPAMPSVVSDVCSPFGEKLNIFERAFNAFAAPYIDFVLGYPVHQSFKPPYNVIDIRNFEPEASFVFLNSNPFVDFPRPTLTKTVEIGGISVDLNRLRSEKLDGKWSNILNQRKKTILVSFGSVMFSKDMPMENKIALAKVMKKFLEVTFIWKYESNDTDSFAKGIENIHFSSWVPQTALLADSRLSAFFTHAGLGSINEVSYLGKPAILCPLFADQMRNAKMLARHNGSMELTKYELADTKKISEAFQKILFDESYAESAEKLARQLESQPIKPKDLLVKHAEFAARFGRLPGLDPYSRKMSFIEYFLIDVATFFTPTIIRKFAKINYVKSTKHVVHLEPSEKLEQYGNFLENNDIVRFWTDDASMSEMFPMLELFNSMFLEQAMVLGHNLEFLDELNASKFDVMIYESFVECAYPLLDYLEIKTFIPSTSIAYDPNLLESIGEPRMPSAVPLSFGSVMFSKDMPMENKIALAKVMKKFPEVTFIWKYESNDTDNFAKGINNIHFSSWVPQTALLADSRLSAFFTHAGLGSINEVSYLGKPVLCPLFADQMRNAKMLVRKLLINGSIEVSKYELHDAKKIGEVLRKILFDDSYRVASENLARQLANQPMEC